VDLNLELLKGIGIETRHKISFNMPTYTISETVEDILPKKKRYVVIHPGLGKGNRPWLPDRYRAVIQRIVSLGYHVVITGGGAECAVNLSCIEGLHGVTNLTGLTSLQDLAAVIQKAQCFISVDTGPMHLACALGIPVVLISPSKYVKATRWGPYGVHSIIIKPQQPCNYRCYPYTCKKTICIDNISITQVISGFQKLLKRTDPVDQEKNKLMYLKASVNILDLSFLDLKSKLIGWRVFNRIDMDQGLFKYIIKNDIQLIVKSHINFIERLVIYFAALWLSNPPQIIKSDDVDPNNVQDLIVQRMMYNE